MANDHEHKVVLNEDHKPKEDFIEAKIAIRALILGIIIGSTSIASFHVNFSELTIYFTILSFFHFLEFWITALYNPLNVSISSFLFSNGNQYILAHCFSILEYLLEYLFFPQMKMHKLINYTGLSGNLQFSKKYNDFKGFAIACGGQLCRSLSMIHATHNFSHKISLKKSDDHFLVTDGIYRWIRHPSYFGFFYWAIGSQIMLINPLSIIIFIIILWNFFSKRIRYIKSIILTKLIYIYR